MSEENGTPEVWSDTVSEASRHVQERTIAEEEATERAKAKPTARWVVAALAVLTVVIVWDIRALTATPDPPSTWQQEVDLRWLVSDVVEEVEDFRSAEGRLPGAADLEHVLDDDIVYEAWDGVFMVVAEGDGVRLQFDGTIPLAEWVTLVGPHSGPEALR